MTRPQWLAAIALATALLVGCSDTVPPELTAEQQATTRQQATQAVAWFVSFDDCRYTEVEVYAWRGSWRYEPGRPNRAGDVSVYVHQMETCSGWNTVFSGWGSAELLNPDVTITGNLGRARLRKSIDVRDWLSGSVFTVDVDLTWTGVGDLWRFKDRRHEDYGNIKTRFRYATRGRSADVSGSLLVLGAPGISVAMPGAGYLSDYTFAATTVETKRPTAPTILYFDGYPSEVFAGGTTTLYWWVVGSEPLTLTVDQGVGDVSGSDFVTVAPTETTTYTLTASNSRGSDSAQFTVHVMPPPQSDWAEPNDEPDAARPITLDFHAYDLTITPGDVDWFTFTLDEGARVTVDAWPMTPGFYPLVVLLDDALQLVAADASWLVTNLARGTYYIALTAEPDYGFTGHHSASGYYSLSVGAVAPPSPDRFEPNDDPSIATVIALDFHADLTITPGDVDWFTFTLDEDGVVVVNVWSYDFYGLVSLFDGSMALLADYAAWFRDLLPAGTYYLAVTSYPDYGFSGDHEGFGSYELFIGQIATQGPDALEPNDTRHEATPILLDYVSPRLTITPGDVDWFTFGLAEPAIVVADVDARGLSSTLDAMLRLFDANGDVIHLDDDGGYHDHGFEAHLGPGTYYIAVTGYADFWFVGEHVQDGFYDLTVRATP